MTEIHLLQHLAATLTPPRAAFTPPVSPVCCLCLLSPTGLFNTNRRLNFILHSSFQLWFSYSQDTKQVSSGRTWNWKGATGPVLWVTSQRTALLPPSCHQAPPYSPLPRLGDRCWTSHCHRFPSALQPKTYSRSIHSIHSLCRHVLALLTDVINNLSSFCFGKAKRPRFVHVALSQCRNSEHLLHRQYSKLDCARPV